MKNNKKSEPKKYSTKYFKEGLPEWKRIKDPFTSRIFYRPVSFFLSSIATKMGLTANAVSYTSIFFAIAAFIGLIIPNHIANIIGAIFVNIWLLSDCTDGNIARSVKKQPFGDFADSASSYILVALLGTGLGLTAYFQGGLLINPGCVWILLLGALASSSDTLMRLIYQKFKASEKNLVEAGRIEMENEKRTDESQTNSLLVRIESDLGIGGIIPLLTLICVLLNAADIAVLYCFAYYFLSSVAMILKYTRKAIKKTAEIERRETK